MLWAATVTPGKAAPEGSNTDPRIVPSAVWPRRQTGRVSANNSVHTKAFMENHLYDDVEPGRCFECLPPDQSVGPTRRHKPAKRQSALKPQHNAIQSDPKLEILHPSGQSIPPWATRFWNRTGGT